MGSGAGRAPSWTTEPLRTARRAAALLVAAALGACGDGPAGPDPEELTLELVSGAGQVGLESWPLLEPIVVRAVNREGAAVAGVHLTFSTAEGHGIPLGREAETDPAGTASVRWQVGSATEPVQTLTVRVTGGTAALDVEARVVGPEAADHVVARGAGGPLRGFALVRPGAPLEVLASRPTADTALAVPLVNAPGVELLVFGHDNRPLWAAPAWTPARDTVTLELLPAVPLVLDVHVQVGEFDAQKAIIQDQVAEAAGIWWAEGVGVAFDTVRFFDETSAGAEVHLSSSGLCARSVPDDAIQVYVVSSIDGGNVTGWGCWAGHIWLAEGTDRFPTLLAHELGHTFTLEHTERGLMFPNRPGRGLTEGEIFRAHFHAESALNRIFGAQPAALLRACHLDPSPCLDERYRVDAAPGALVAARPGGP